MRQNCWILLIPQLLSQNEKQQIGTQSPDQKIVESSRDLIGSLGRIEKLKQK